MNLSYVDAERLSETLLIAIVTAVMVSVSMIGAIFFIMFPKLNKLFKSRF